MAIYGIRWCCAPFIMIPLICWNCTKGAPASPPPIPRGCPLIQVRLFQTKLIMCACVWLNLAISWRSWRNRGTVRAENMRSLQLGENQLSPILKSIIAPEYLLLKAPLMIEAWMYLSMYSYIYKAIAVWLTSKGIMKIETSRSPIAMLTIRKLKVVFILARVATM